MEREQQWWRPMGSGGSVVIGMVTSLFRTFGQMASLFLLFLFIFL